MSQNTVGRLINNLSKEKKIYSFGSETTDKYWISEYPIGRKWFDGRDWWIRTDENESGRIKLKNDDELLKPVIPLFCPKCKRIIKRKEDEAAVVLRGHCYICELDDSAEKEFNKQFEKNN
jgi:uncharacterized C2H2 Zn-finger protein